MDYLEFGVYEGRSLAYWGMLNPQPDSRFFGFDSFEGLPEGWNSTNPAGSYNAHGKIPQTSDSRVEFVVGWFQKSLPLFLAAHKPKNPLVLHSDGDLYSSTLCSLSAMDSWIVPGTLLIFDEFFDPVHEYRALEDYVAAYMRKYEVVAATQDFVQAAVKIL